MRVEARGDGRRALGGCVSDEVGGGGVGVGSGLRAGIRLCILDVRRPLGSFRRGGWPGAVGVAACASPGGRRAGGRGVERAL